MTQIGIMIEGQNGLNWARWQRILQAAEDFGYQCVFRSDHFTNASGDDIDSLELWTSLTYAASHTSRIEFGSLVTPVTFRHPSMTVRYASAVDDLSKGRLVLGMGAGWQEREHKKFGIAFYDVPTRFSMLEEALQLTIRLLESNEPVDFDGEHFTLEDATLLPRPARVGGPPILIGGNGPKLTLPLVARFADEWNAVFLPLADYRDRVALMKELLDKQGRPADDIKYSMMTQVIYEPTQEKLDARVAKSDRSAEEMQTRGMIVGTGQAVVDQISALSEAGLQRIMLQWLDLDNIDGLESMAKDVLPHFHKS